MNVRFRFWKWPTPWCATIAIVVGVILLVGLSFLRYIYEPQPSPPNPIQVGDPVFTPLPDGFQKMVAHYSHHYPGPCFRAGQYTMSEAGTGADDDADTSIDPAGPEIGYRPLGGVMNGYGQHSLGARFRVKFLIWPDEHGPREYWFRTGFDCPLMLPFGWQLFRPPILIRHFDADMRVDIILP